MLAASVVHAASVNPAFVPLLKQSFLHGREYFVLRSGRAKLIAQADQADVAPALLYLLFDAQDIFDKARWGLPAMVADNGVMDAGMCEYGAQWVRDTSDTLLGLVHAGHFELVRSGLTHVLEDMVNLEGNAMIAGGFDDPDREQFDQMGELLHALKAYRDWTGDDSLVKAGTLGSHLYNRQLTASQRGELTLGHVQAIED